jgi:hypothetical protein
VVWLFPEAAAAYVAKTCLLLATVALESGRGVLIALNNEVRARLCDLTSVRPTYRSSLLAQGRQPDGPVARVIANGRWLRSESRPLFEERQAQTS